MDDMYGHEIVPLGETGFGVSTEFYLRKGERHPMFWFFHVSDGFRQALFGVDSAREQDSRPGICNVFDDRMAEVREARRGAGSHAP